MKEVIIFLLLFVGAMQARFYLEGNWEIVPAEHGKWRACYTKYGWSGASTNCGSEVEFDEAWWRAKKIP